MSNEQNTVIVHEGTLEHQPFPEFGIQTADSAAPHMRLIELAIKQGAPIETLKEIFALQREYEAGEAKKAYNLAFSAFKAEAITIIKNVTYKDGPLKGKKHADLFAVVDAVTPALSRHDLSMSWSLTKDEKDWLEVTCTVRHRLGHSESVSMGSGPDAGPARNAIQARASAKTYLERYTATAILGLAAQDMDDDGAATEEWPELKACLAAIKQAPDSTALKTVYNSAFKKAKAANQAEAMMRIIDAKDSRQAEIAQDNPA